MLIVAATLTLQSCKKDNSGKRTNNEEPDKPAATWADQVITLEYTALTTASYEIAAIDYMDLKNSAGKNLYELLDYSSAEEMVAALGDFPEDKEPDTGAELLFFGNDPVTESDVMSTYNTNGAGYWLNGYGAVQGWGPDARMYIEAYWGNDEEEGYYFSGGVGVMPGVTVAGDKYEGRMVLQRTKSATEIIRVGIQYIITMEEFKDEEASKYDASKRTIGTKDINLTGDLSVATGYTGLSFNIADDVQNALQLSKYQMTQVETVSDDDGNFYSGFKFETLQNGTVLDGKTTNLWLDIDANPIGWGEGAIICFEHWYNVNEVAAHVCTYAEEGNTSASAVGKTYSGVTQRITYLPADCNGDLTKATIVNLNYTIKVVE